MKTVDFKYQPPRAISWWLLVTMLMVIAMIVLGGATRLTNSGLSITEWKPITGAVPPLSHEAWLSEFEKYKQIPEFEAEHPDMTLRGFEFIYFMEWSHRLLGRLIGLVYTIPFFIFTIHGHLKGKVARHFLVVCLIGVQGAIGWWMVHSGLSDDRVDVSQYRLATHLGVAFVILALLFFFWRDSADGTVKVSSGRGSLARKTSVLTVLVYLQILSGAFVAGTHSGKTYNTWPLMDGDVVPSGYFAQNPIWRNFFENTAAIQFNHRLLAYLIVLAVIWIALLARNVRAARGAIIALSLLVLWQVLLGILTLLSVAPLNLSLLHQFSSILVFLSSLWLWRIASRLEV